MLKLKKEVNKIIGKENIDYYDVLKDKSTKPSLMNIRNLFSKEKDGTYSLSLVKSISNEKTQKVKDYINEVSNSTIKIEIKLLKDMKNKNYEYFKTKEEADKYYNDRCETDNESECEDEKPKEDCFHYKKGIYVDSNGEVLYCDDGWTPTESYY